jgi:putative membrane protein
MMDWQHDGSGWGTGWGGWLVMMLAMVAFWTLVVLAVVALFRESRPQREAPPGRSAFDVLAERFARGEIDAEEYHRREEVLRAVTSSRDRSTP